MKYIKVEFDEKQAKFNFADGLSPDEFSMAIALQILALSDKTKTPLKQTFENIEIALKEIKPKV
jgi:hypothetical protein